MKTNEKIAIDALTFISQQPCDNANTCRDTDKCITEYCLSCYASAKIDEISAANWLAITPEPISAPPPPPPSQNAGEGPLGANATPRTDVEVNEAAFVDPRIIPGDWVSATFARTLETELGEARKNEAVCHCGERVSAHRVYSTCNHFVELKETCPYAEDLHEARAALAGISAALQQAQNPNAQ